MEENAREKIAEDKAKEWAAKMKETHQDTNRDWILFSESSLAHLIKKCLLMSI